MNLEELKDKSICLIVWNTEKKDDVHVYLGNLYMENDESFFINKAKGWRVSLDEEQLSRLKPVTEDLRETFLNADYALSFSMSNLPDTESEDFKSTGMNWHD